MKMINEHSAGGVVYRKFRIQNSPASPRLGRGRAEFRIKWLICQHSGYHKWVLPKGIVEAEEDSKETAVREVLEETGVKAEILRKITPDVRYKYMKKGTLINKRVEFYLMKYVAGEIKNHSWEMEEVRWVTSEEGWKLLAFETEKNALNKAGQMLQTSII